MNEIIKVNYDSEQPTVSARELHEKLEVGTKFTTWFERMREYGFSSGKEFFPKMGETSEIGGRPPLDYDLTIRCAKEICIAMKAKNKTAEQFQAKVADEIIPYLKIIYTGMQRKVMGCCEWLKA